MCELISPCSKLVGCNAHWSQQFRAPSVLCRFPKNFSCSHFHLIFHHFWTFSNHQQKFLSLKIGHNFLFYCFKLCFSLIVIIRSYQVRSFFQSEVVVWIQAVAQTFYLVFALQITIFVTPSYLGIYLGFLRQTYFQEIHLISSQVF